MLTLLLVGCDAGVVTTRPGKIGFDTGGGITAVGGPGVVVLAGGGSEGDEGDEASWSARLYQHLLDGGDVTGDGRVSVAIVSAAEETEWLPDYFEWLGADEAVNIRVGSRDYAEALDIGGEYDAAFIKGGDQSEYEALWAGTSFLSSLRSLHDDWGGGIGGTSAGAMILGDLAWVGDQDLVSLDVLTDCDSPYLYSSDGTFGLVNGSVSAVSRWLIDTHFSERGRLGRLAALMGPAGKSGLGDWGVGISERTGVWIEDGAVNVVGEGTVTRIQPGEWSCAAGSPPVATDMRVDRLTDGWTWAVSDGTLLPSYTAEPVAWDGVTGPVEGEWYADGDLGAHEERFAWVAERAPLPYATHAGTDLPVLADAIGVLDAEDPDTRGISEEALFRALYDHVGSTGFLVARGSSLERDEVEPARIAATDNPEVDDEGGAAVIVVDSAGATWRDLSPEVSSADAGDGSLHAAGLVGLTMHLLYTPVDGARYDSVEHTIVGP